jgi:hypothetical protein
MSNVIICGVVKNVQHCIQNNIILARKLGEKCNSYKIVIYENNSTDNTKNILKSYKNDIDCKIIMENIDDNIIKQTSKIWAYTKITGSDHPCRIEQISNARNKLIDEINKDEYLKYDTVVLVDLDSQYWDIGGVLESIEIIQKNKNIVLYANSQQYYDYYALRGSYNGIHNLFGPELTGDYFWKNFKNIFINSCELVPVYSAFNGIGVMNKEIFKKYRYDCIVNNEVKKTYQTIMTNHNDTYNLLAPYIQTECSKFPGGDRDGELFWKNNSGYNKPVICEHVPFNFHLINNGYKIYINPKMLYWR